MVREALKLLPAQGIIEVRNGKNAVVKSISIEPWVAFFQRATGLEDNSFADFIEIRRALEIQTAMVAPRSRTPQEMQGINEMLVAK